MQSERELQTLARTLATKEDITQADHTYKNLIRSFPTAINYKHYAIFLHNTKNFERSILYFNKALLKDENIFNQDGMSYAMLGNACSQTGYYPLARDSYQNALKEIQNGDVLTSYYQYQYAKACLNCKDYEQALKKYQELLILYSDNLIWHRDYHRDIAEIYQQLNNYPKAIEHHEKAMQAGYIADSDYLTHKLIPLYKLTNQPTKLLANLEELRRSLKKTDISQPVRDCLNVVIDYWSNPENPENLHETIKRLEIIAYANKTEDSIWYDLIYFYYKAGRYIDGIHAILHVLEKNPCCQTGQDYLYNILTSNSIRTYQFEQALVRKMLHFAKQHPLAEKRTVLLSLFLDSAHHPGKTFLTDPQTDKDSIYQIIQMIPDKRARESFLIKANKDTTCLLYEICRKGRFRPGFFSTTKQLDNDLADLQNPTVKAPWREFVKALMDQNILHKKDHFLLMIGMIPKIFLTQRYNDPTMVGMIILKFMGTLHFSDQLTDPTLKFLYDDFLDKFSSQEIVDAILSKNIPENEFFIPLRTMTLLNCLHEESYLGKRLLQSGNKYVLLDIVLNLPEDTDAEIKIKDEIYRRILDENRPEDKLHQIFQEPYWGFGSVSKEKEGSVIWKLAKDHKRLCNLLWHDEDEITFLNVQTMRSGTNP